MVSEKQKDNKTYYMCDICKLAYKKKEMALKCESWCKDNPGSCNPDVVKFAVDID